MAVIASPMIWKYPGAKRLVLVAAVLAVLPDIDAIGRPFQLGDIAALGGHRAVTHSVFAALLGALGVAYVWHRRISDGTGLLRVFTFVALVMISHGLLDTMATYGEGVAFFAPFSLARYQSPWQPFSGILAEVVALWVPAALMAIYIRRASVMRAPLPAAHVP